MCKNGDETLKKYLIFIFLTAFVSGCVGLSQIRADNRQKLNGLSVGLTKQEILNIMGTKTVQAQGSVITNPYRTEMHQTNGLVFEVLFYYTDIQKQDGAITDDELTPLIIKDGKLDGWGWSYWNNLINKYEIRVR